MTTAPVRPADRCVACGSARFGAVNGPPGKERHADAAICVDLLQAQVAEERARHTATRVATTTDQARAARTATQLATATAQIAALQHELARERARSTFLQQARHGLAWGLVGPLETPDGARRPGVAVLRHGASQRPRQLSYAWYADHHGDRAATEGAAIDLAIIATTDRAMAIPDPAQRPTDPTA